ncbi:MAG: CidA/LrgA family protein [Tenericutes bacterium]|nr:CidA/LrgA family protein [Mycoplasmatota bacterium]
MKYIQQLGLILVILFISNYLSNLISSFFLLPGPILGMILLFLLLKLKVIKLSHIEELALFMFSIIALFFLPSGISLMNYLDLIKSSFIPIIFIGIVITIIALALTMKFMDLLVLISTRKENKDV